MDQFLYVCDRSHPDNFFHAPTLATETSASGTEETNALCVCGGVARRVLPGDALLLLNPAEQATVYGLEMNTEELPALQGSVQ